MLTLSAVGQSNVVNPYEANQFVSTWRTSNTSSGSSTATQVRLPLISTGTYNFVVEWGDGTSDTITVWNQAETTHTYSVAQLYQIKITGTCNGWRFANAGDRLKILSVEKWGNAFRLGATDQHFNGCNNLELQQVEDVLDLTGTTSFASSFRGCGRLTVVKNMNSWNTTNITSFNATFRNSSNFNSNIGNWNTSNVNTMLQMFQIDSTTNMSGVFNQNIGNWNTSKVTTMLSMFVNQEKFNQDISTKEVTIEGVTYTAWDTLNVTDMNAMFAITPVSGTTVREGNFNQNITNWNTSKVTNMSQMFQVQPNFNQDISTKEVTVNGVTYTAWDTLNVTNMSFMLYASFPLSIGTFNQNIGNWNTSKVTNMGSVLAFQPNFNQDISTKVVTVGASTYTAWDTLNVTAMNSMFFIASDATGSFNQNITNWNTSKVTNINSIFTRQSNFNQNIGIWDVSKVTNMSRMLLNTTNFNQNLGSWNVSLVTLFNSATVPTDTFADGIGLSTANYDALLIGWASRPVQPNLPINFGTVKYSSAAVAARAILTSAPNNWTIVDGGLE